MWNTFLRVLSSARTQVISITHDLSSVLNKGGQTDLILLDFAKPFDKIPHKRIIMKLSNHGIRNNTLQWIAVFPLERTQQVGHVTSGLPQGSVLRTTLFIIYLNNAPGGIYSKARLFADDSTMCRHVTSLENCKNLKRYAETTSRMQIEFNIKKCYVLIFANK